MSTISIPKEVDKTGKDLIECFESAIQYLEEVRRGDLEHAETGNLYYLIHDWSIRHESYNDALQHYWDILAKFYEEKFPNELSYN